MEAWEALELVMRGEIGRRCNDDVILKLFLVDKRDGENKPLFRLNEKNTLQILSVRRLCVMKCYCPFGTDVV